MEHLVIRDSRFGFDPEAEPLVPAMAMHVEACCRRGVIARSVKKLTLERVTFDGVEGEPLDTEEVGETEIL